MLLSTCKGDMGDKGEGCLLWSILFRAVFHHAMVMLSSCYNRDQIACKCLKYTAGFLWKHLPVPRQTEAFKQLHLKDGTK